MKALILGSDGIPQTVDNSIAFHGFEKLEYDIEIEQVWFHLNKKELEEYDVCVAGVDVIRHALFQLEVKTDTISCYPKKLYQFLERDVIETTVFDIYKYYRHEKFIKPVISKRFEAFMMGKKFKLSEHPVGFDYKEKIYVVDPIKFISEWRVYVRMNRIESICNYMGDPTSFPSIKTINDMIEEWKSDSPCCYALDVGIATTSSTVLVEVNDFYSIGNYGLNCETYAEMLQLRWSELLNSRRVEKLKE